MCSILNNQLQRREKIGLRLLKIHPPPTHEGTEKLTVSSKECKKKDDICRLFSYACSS